MKTKCSRRKKFLDDKDGKVLVENTKENAMISAESVTILLAEKTEEIITGCNIQNELNGEGFTSCVSKKLPFPSKKILMIGLMG
jgi:hypothetical protein